MSIYNSILSAVSRGDYKASLADLENVITRYALSLTDEQIADIRLKGAEKYKEFNQPTPQIMDLQARVDTLEGNGDSAKARLNALMQEKFLNEADDETALKLAELYADWDASVTYDEGQKVKFGGLLFKAVSQNTGVEPEGSTVWSVIKSTETYAEWVMPGTSGGYALGACVTHNGSTYQSTIDNNYNEPGSSTSDGWVLI